jgi:hypothetical protein
MEAYKNQYPQKDVGDLLKLVRVTYQLYDDFLGLVVIDPECEAGRYGFEFRWM